MRPLIASVTAFALVFTPIMHLYSQVAAAAVFHSEPRPEVKIRDDTAARDRAFDRAETAKRNYDSRLNPLLQKIGISLDEAHSRIKLFEDVDLIRYGLRGSERKTIDVTDAIKRGVLHPNSSSHLGIRRPYGVFGRSEPGRPLAATRLLGPLLRPTTLIVNAMPSDRKTFKNVFGSDAVASAGALSQVAASNRSIESLKGVHMTATDIDSIKKEMHDVDPGVVIFVGHNEGGVLSTPSGGRITIDGLAKICAEQGRVCVHLSCSAGKYLKHPGSVGPRADISVAQAARIAAKLVAILAAEPTAKPLAIGDAKISLVYADPWKTIGKLDDAIQADAKHQARMYYVGVIIAGVFIIIMVMLLLDDQDDAKKAEARRQSGNG